MYASRDELTGKWTLEGVEDDKITFKNICEMLKSGKNFKFARYGDGEIACMMRKEGRNTDKHQYFKDLGENLVKSALLADYMVGIQPLAVSMHEEYINKIFENYKDKNQLFNADVLHSASIDGKFYEFMESFKHRHIIYVGPIHLTEISEDNLHIVTDYVDCWKQYEQICQDLDFYIDGIVNAVVLLSCSMMAEVIIDRFKDYPHTFIDTGSLFDPYCGVNSRKYHFKLKI